MALQHSAKRSICLAGTWIRHIDFLDFTRALLCVRRILISLSVEFILPGNYLSSLDHTSTTVYLR